MQLALRSTPGAIATRKAAAARVPAPLGVRRARAVCANAMPVAEVASVADTLYEALKPQADYFSTLGLPEPLIHWGHPGNMAVVLFAMGLYGSGYLGYQIRTSGDEAVLQKAKDLHPKLAAGMFFFFSLGALGGIMSLMMQGRAIFESTHVTTGLAGLGLLSVQAVLPTLFGSNADLRTVHAYLGSSILLLFLVHMALGIQLGLSI